LGVVSCPTLIINGVDDEVQDSCVAPLFHGIKRARWITFGSSTVRGANFRPPATGNLFWPLCPQNPVIRHKISTL
jgi:hypothetical protein